MSNEGDQFKLSRREFARAAAVSVVTGAAAGKVAAMNEQTEPATRTDEELIESRVRSLEDQLARPIPPALREKVARHIANNDSMARRGRGFRIPDGTEPAFAFHPMARNG